MIGAAVVAVVVAVVAAALIAYDWGREDGYANGYHDGFHDPQGWHWVNDPNDPVMSEWRPRTPDERRSHLRVIDPRKEEPSQEEE